MIMKRSDGRQAYFDIAEELGGDLTLDDLDENAVKLAREYARRNHQKWPPKPQSSGWNVTVFGY